MPLSVSIPWLILWLNVHVDMSAIKGSKAVGKEGLIFRIVGDSWG
jgi:hypothetical protein